MLNKTFLIGRLGHDPEVKYTQSGIAVCTLNIATTERRKIKDNWEDATEWHRVVVWKSRAENCSKFLQKGSLVHIEGRFQTRKWQDEVGNDRYTKEIQAYDIKFLSPKRQEIDQDNKIQDINDNDMPF